MQRHLHSGYSNFLLGSVVCLISTCVLAGPKTLPETVVHAHTVFLENETGYADLQYAAILELNKWGRFEMAESREKADLIMRLDNGSHVRVVPAGQFPSRQPIDASADEEIPKGCTRIVLLDPKTNAALWSDFHKTEGGKVKSGHLLDGLREAFESYEKTRR